MGETKSNKLRSLALPLLLGGSLLSTAGLAYWFLSPKTYQAATRLRIVDWVKSADLKKVSDERVVFVECDLIRSNAVMDEAIQSLHLTDVWGKRYHPGTPLTFEEARARLRACARVQPVPHSSVIDIRVNSEDPEETARIANALARAYLDFRQARHQELIQARLGGLKQQWDAQAEKIRAAQVAVDELYFRITRERSTNATQFYDTDAYDLLLAGRAQLKTKYIDQQSQLAGLKKLDREQLKDVLSSMDTNTDITPTLLRINQAKSDLSTIRVDHGDDSPEVRKATLVLGKLNEQLNREIDAAMKVRATQLAALQTMLDELEHRIKNASTNAAKLTIQDADYKKALQHLGQLKTERDDLQKTMDAEQSQDAIRPTGVTADIIQTAETPKQPYMPEPGIALGALISGAVLAAVAFVLLMARRRPETAIRTQPLLRK